MERAEEITDLIIRASIVVHRNLGPGLLESTYQTCLAYELLHRNLRVERQKPVPITYDGLRLDAGYRVDLLVEDLVIVELKSVARLEPIHIAQVLTYLKLSGYSVGLLLNFNVELMKDGIRRLVNNYPDADRLPHSARVPRR